MNARYFAAACGFLALLPALAQCADAPRVFLLDANELAHNRDELRAGDTRLAPALDKLNRDADHALKAGPFSVVHKKNTPPSGDKHDYMSFAPYWWPNPDKPDGLPYIRRDGERNPERRGVSDRDELDLMVDSVETLALAWYFTNDETFAEHARRLVRAWFIDPQTRMNPSFQYAQAVPGRSTGRGFGLIDSHCLTRLIDAIGLLDESKAWTPGDDRALHQWFGEFLDWVLETEMGRDEASQKNNHGTYYDVQVCSYAFYVGRPEVARKVLEAASKKRIAVQVEPDGSQPLELARTNAWGYSLANLRGLMKLARLADHVDVDLWNYKSDDGRSIRAAAEFLAPYGLDGKAWPFQQIGGFHASVFHPVARQAAAHYPDAPFSSKIKLRPPKPTDRENLIGS